MRRLSASLIVATALLAGCAAANEPEQDIMAAFSPGPDLTNQFLLGHLDDSKISDPILRQIVYAMRRDDFFRLTLEQASCGAAGAQYWAGFDNQYNIALEGDPVTALMWYTLAAGQGHSTAENASGKLAAQMTAADVALAKDRASRWRPADC